MVARARPGAARSALDRLAVEAGRLVGHSLTMRFPVSAMRVSLVTLALSACVPPPAQPPAAPPPPAPEPAPAPPPPLAKDWRDWPVAAGTWSYRPEAGGSTALFGPAGAAATAAIRCRMATKQVDVMRTGTVSAAEMIVTTSFGVVRWPAAMTQTTLPQIVATRAAGDAALDQIAYSRGRFVIETAGLPALVLPTLPEIARVIEDCRS